MARRKGKWVEKMGSSTGEDRIIGVCPGVGTIKPELSSWDLGNNWTHYYLYILWFGRPQTSASSSINKSVILSRSKIWRRDFPSAILFMDIVRQDQENSQKVLIHDPRQSLYYKVSNLMRSFYFITLCVFSSLWIFI